MKYCVVPPCNLHATQILWINATFRIELHVIEVFFLHAIFFLGIAMRYQNEAKYRALQWVGFLALSRPHELLVRHACSVLLKVVGGKSSTIQG